MVGSRKGKLARILAFVANHDPERMGAVPIMHRDLPAEPKLRLLALTPRSYIGLAAELAKKI